VAGRPTSEQIHKARVDATRGASIFNSLAWKAGIITALATLASAGIAALLLFGIENPVVWGYSVKLGVLAGVLLLIGAALGVLTVQAA
jgi:hypothetical protein